MSDAFNRAIRELDDQDLQLLYGRCDPLAPEQVADLLAPAAESEHAGG